ncbi:MAG: hypothetical protein IT435_13370 [Phycisphaerales bacterium]|nr:hypothetical protein [Phycisphaerales bacterium]
MRITLWVYVLPPAENPTNQNTKPFNATGANLRMEFSWGTFSSTKKHSRPVEFSAIHGRGWVPIVVFLKMSEWIGTVNPTSPFELYMRLSCAGSVLNRQDVLVAFDSVLVASATPENPGQPLRFENSTPAEKLSSTGWGFGDSWTLYVAGRVPETGADIFSATNGWPLFDPSSPTNTGRVLITLYESSTKYIKVILDRRPVQVSGSPPTELVENVIYLVDHTGAYSPPLRGPTSSVDTSFTQPFLFLKGRQFIIGISYDQSINSGAGGYRLWASVGGTEVASIVITGLAKVKPVTIQTGDNTKENVDPGQFFIMAGDSANATTIADGKAAIETLSFWP